MRRISMVLAGTLFIAGPMITGHAAEVPIPGWLVAENGLTLRSTGLCEGNVSLNYALRPSDPPGGVSFRVYEGCAIQIEQWRVTPAAAPLAPTGAVIVDAGPVGWEGACWISGSFVRSPAGVSHATEETGDGGWCGPRTFSPAIRYADADTVGFRQGWGPPPGSFDGYTHYDVFIKDAIAPGCQGWYSRDDIGTLPTEPDCSWQQHTVEFERGQDLGGLIGPMEAATIEILW